MMMRDIPLFDRPREKAMRQGFEKLSDAELLAIMLGKGYRGASALDVANELLKKSKGLYNLDSLNEQDLKSIKGISSVKAIQLLSMFKMMNRIKEQKLDLIDRVVDTDYIIEKYGDYFINIHQEVVLLLVLNRAKKLVFEHQLYKGNDYLVPISIKEIVKNVILHDGYYFYLIHNHPCGNATPSPQDILLTFRLKTSIKKMGIHLLDHLIIHSSGYTSINDYLNRKYNKRTLLQIPAE